MTFFFAFWSLSIYFIVDTRFHTWTWLTLLVSHPRVWTHSSRQSRTPFHARAIVERHVEVTLTSVFACCDQDAEVSGIVVDEELKTRRSWFPQFCRVENGGKLVLQLSSFMFCKLIEIPGISWQRLSSSVRSWKDTWSFIALRCPKDCEMTELSDTNAWTNPSSDKLFMFAVTCSLRVDVVTTSTELSMFCSAKYCWPTSWSTLHCRKRSWIVISPNSSTIGGSGGSPLCSSKRTRLTLTFFFGRVEGGTPCWDGHACSVNDRTRIEWHTCDCQIIDEASSGHLVRTYALFSLANGRQITTTANGRS